MMAIGQLTGFYDDGSAVMEPLVCESPPAMMTTAILADDIWSRLLDYVGLIFFRPTEKALIECVTQDLSRPWISTVRYGYHFDYQRNRTYQNFLITRCNPNLSTDPYKGGGTIEDTKKGRLPQIGDVFKPKGGEAEQIMEVYRTRVGGSVLLQFRVRTESGQEVIRNLSDFRKGLGAFVGSPKPMKRSSGPPPRSSKGGAPQNKISAGRSKGSRPPSPVSTPLSSPRSDSLGLDQREPPPLLGDFDKRAISLKRVEDQLRNKEEELKRKEAELMHKRHALDRDLEDRRATEQRSEREKGLNAYQEMLRKYGTEDGRNLDPGTLGGEKGGNSLDEPSPEEDSEEISHYKRYIKKYSKED